MADFTVFHCQNAVCMRLIHHVIATVKRKDEAIRIGNCVAVHVCIFNEQV